MYCRMLYAVAGPAAPEDAIRGGVNEAHIKQGSRVERDGLPGGGAQRPEPCGAADGRPRRGRARFDSAPGSASGGLQQTAKVATEDQRMTVYVLLLRQVVIVDSQMAIREGRVSELR